jgi:octaprenyl-diphosphate synthase
MHSTKGMFVEPSGSVTMASLTKPLAPLMASLDAFLDAEDACFEPEVRELVRYTFAHSGKRLRPILVFFSGWGGAGRKEDLVKAAAVVEMVHLATLVHDDILDGATLRHKAPTLVAQNGAHVAVLLGDALFSEALRLAAQFPTTEVCRTVALATRNVCSGEIGQTFQRGNDRLSREAYFRVIELKTAELFRAACYLGAFVGGYGDAFAKAADRYGMHLGTAYQIYDDLADLMGDEATIGKTLGTDLASGKFTLPLLILMDGRDADGREQFARKLAGMDSAELKELLVGTDVAARVKSALNAEVDAALEAIAPFASLPPVEPMDALAMYVRGLMTRL